MTAQRKRPAAGRRLFIKHLRKSGNVTRAAEAAGVSRNQLYLARRDDPDFALAWEEALEGAMDDLEATLLRRALEGTDKPVFFGGKECGTVKSYSDSLGMFLLKGRRRDIFGERSGQKKTQVGGAVAGVEKSENLVSAREIIEARLTELAARKRNS